MQYKNYGAEAPLKRPEVALEVIECQPMRIDGASTSG